MQAQDCDRISISCIVSVMKLGLENYSRENSMITAEMAAWLKELRRWLCRYAVVLAGADSWGREVAQRLVADMPEPVLWVGRACPEATGELLEVRRVGRALGREYGAVVFDAHHGFDPDAFGLVSGCLRGGGALFLLTPRLDCWPRAGDPALARLTSWPAEPSALESRFLRRFVALIEADERCVLLRQQDRLPVLPAPVAAPSKKDVPDPACRSADQARAVAAIIHVLRGHRRRPLIIDADRGRGKSSALGIASARLLQQGVRHIVVTGPRLAAVDPVFERVRHLLPGCEMRKAVVHWQGRLLEFVAPDELLRQPRRPDLLLVDEAAALPAALLVRLLEHHARIVFASTVHGYEGSGRGFALRFRRLLDQQTPGWRALRLHTPIRWCEQDPLEGFVFQALLLDAAPPALASGGGGLRLERLDRDRLWGDETRLRQIFALLVGAHYRTSPSDLRVLLDSPGITVFALYRDEMPLAAALVTTEGQLPADLAHAVYLGRRRVRGHLLAQSLAAHVGVPEGAGLRLARVMRIAVHPERQGQGLGTRLLQAVRAWAGEAGHDAWGASFGANPRQLRFWRRLGFEPVRLGLRREPSSGEHSVLMLAPLSAAGERVFTQARSRFAQALPCQLADPLRELDPRLAALLLAGSDSARAPAAAVMDDVKAFACHRRSFETSLPALSAFSLQLLRCSGSPLSETEQALLVAKLLQHGSWSEVAARLGYSGKKAIVAALRQSIARGLSWQEEQFAS